MGYDSTYTKTNLRFYNAKDIPHFNEKTPDGVFNAEYDCAFDISPAISTQDMLLYPCVVAITIKNILQRDNGIIEV